MRYLIVIEQDGESYGAYCPDVPGCFAVGKTREETINRMMSALALHLEWLRAEGDPIPLPVTQADEAITAQQHETAAWIEVPVA